MWEDETNCMEGKKHYANGKIIQGKNAVCKTQIQQS